ncbi:hypothetical protein PTSG_09618 [Salpingoeca rosetta]|uniref:Uncharacterized protein n=1 Tax=Salpingoeca rosetta (strain ATCC 50818 / BSB-021) TaxID=946362 RepID=F2ULI4_SALR5|nr:uncharacterized protein PTSG_09618 [Salpingoeca rosetta]EGD77983.1 hypothetical protein PTSG_09618 [Salpingoeca rosetta]|eukprot:XP_004990045.1 hypothetical protein PTSG_09618 [Salpingoeca rosetta]
MTVTTAAELPSKEEGLGFSVEEVDTLKRRELQHLCKRFGIKANTKNVQMIAELKQLHETWLAQCDSADISAEDEQQESEEAAGEDQRSDNNMCMDTVVDAHNTNADEVEASMKDDADDVEHDRRVEHQSKYERVDQQKDALDSSDQAATDENTPPTTVMQTEEDSNASEEHAAIPTSPCTPKRQILSMAGTPRSGRKTWRESPVVSSLRRLSHVVDGSTPQSPLAQAPSTTTAVATPSTDLRASIMGDLQRIMQSKRTATPQRAGHKRTSLSTTTTTITAGGGVGRADQRGTPHCRRGGIAEWAKHQTASPRSTTEKKFDRLHRSIKAETLDEERARKEKRRAALCREHNKWDRLAGAGRKKHTPATTAVAPATKRTKRQLHKSKQQQQQPARSSSALRKPTGSQLLRKTQHKSLLASNAAAPTVRSSQMKKKQKAAITSCLQTSGETRIPQRASNKEAPGSVTKHVAGKRKPKVGVLQTPNRNNDDAREEARRRRERQLSYKPPKPTPKRNTATARTALSRQHPAH